MGIEEWLNDMSRYLQLQWGLAASFSTTVALFLLYLYYYGLNPVITSGWRSPAKQADLLRRYQAGDPGVVAKPAVNSLHLNTLLGKPASLAIDISTNNAALAANIAKQLGIRAGYYFTKPDPVHFDTGR